MHQGLQSTSCVAGGSTNDGVETDTVKPTSQRLPDNVVEAVAAALVEEDCEPRVTLLNLLSMCCVCKQWRSVASVVKNSFELVLDTSDCYSTESPLVRRFNQMDVEHRRECFLGVVRLLRGVSDISLRGDAISDALLVQLAQGCRKTIRRICIKATRRVTDKAITILVLLCTRLEHFWLDDLQSAEGPFQVFPRLLLETCTGLKSLHLNQIKMTDLTQAATPPVLPRATQLTDIYLRDLGCNVNMAWIWPNVKLVEVLAVDGPSSTLQDAVASCLNLTSVSYVVTNPLDATMAIDCLKDLPSLKSLQLLVKGFKLGPGQLASAGCLPVTNLHIDSFNFASQPTLGRSFSSHIDNHGVQALVRGLHSRKASDGEDIPVSLSLCGATSLSHEAVGAILMLPLLTGLDISGCRLPAMDKMRLISKVKAGRAIVGLAPCSQGVVAEYSESSFCRRKY